jgi:RNA polymerase sigma-70 factor (ECF subfamily)
MATELSDRTPVRPEDEGQWIAASRDGDRSAFARLVEAYWGRLYRWLFQLTRDRHAAEDLAQDAFLKAWANLNRFQPGSNFRAWLFRIAHNALVNTRRGPRTRRAALSEDVRGAGPGPEDVAQGKETMERVGQAVDQLPTEWRAALLLRVEEGLSFRQIAAITDTTEETARWRVFKARQKLMAWLDGGDEA